MGNQPLNIKIGPLGSGGRGHFPCLFLAKHDKQLGIGFCESTAPHNKQASWHGFPHICWISRQWFRVESTVIRGLSSKTIVSLL